METKFVIATDIDGTLADANDYPSALLYDSAQIWLIWALRLYHVLENLALILRKLPGYLTPAWSLRMIKYLYL